MKFEKSNKILALFLVVVICSLATFTGMAAIANSTLPTTLQNGDFENGTTGWAVTPRTTGTGEGEFSVVDAAEDTTHKVNFTEHAGLFKTTHTSTWLYQGVSLNPGKYTWQFHVDIYGTYIMAGVYSSYANIGKADGLITADEISFIGDTETVYTIKGQGSPATYYYNSYGNGTYSSRNGTVTYEFTLTEKTDVYFAIRGQAGNYHYIDNMTLDKEAQALEELETIFQNGNFENGTTAWNVTPTTSTTGVEAEFSVVNAAQDAAHKVNITGNAGYFKTAHASTWLYQGVSLEAGKYTWKFHMDSYGNYNRIGVYSSYDNIGKAEGLILADAISSALDNGTAVTFSNKNTYYQYFYGQAGTPQARQFTVTYEFTLSEKTNVYFAIRSDTNNYQYIDEMTLTGSKLLNGNFETGDLKGYLTAKADNQGDVIKVVNTAQGTDNVTLDGYAAFLPDKTEFLNQAVILPAGDYTWKFDAKGSATGSYGLFFGVYTALKNNTTGGWGGYGSKTIIPTNEGSTILNHADEITYTNKMGNANINDAYYFVSISGKSYDYTINYKFTLTEETLVYFSMRANNGRTYIDNMSIELPKALDTKLYDFDENGKFDDSFAVSASNQAAGNNMKITTVASGDDNHKNVLNIPKWSGSSNAERPAGARFYKMLEGLKAGTTYKVTFDLKFVDYTKDVDGQWIALTGVTSTKDCPLTLSSGKNILDNDTMGSIAGNLFKLPAKFAAYTSGDYNIEPNTNGKNAVIMWNGGKDWATYTMEFVAESDEYFFYIENYLTLTDLYLDNLQFSVSEAALDETLDNSIIQNKEVPSLLIIGNSLAEDSFNEFENILNASSENKLRVGKYGKSAKSPKYFADIIKNNILGADFYYAEKGYTGENNLSNIVSFSNVKSFTDWDYVLIQTADIEYSEEYEEHTVALVNALVEKGFDKSQIYLYIPWNASQDYLNNFDTAFSTTAEQLEAIESYKTSLEANENLAECTIMSVNEEIYNLQKFIENVHRGEDEGLRLNRIGQTAVSMTLFHRFTAIDVTNASVFNYSNLDFSDKNDLGNSGGTITKVQLDALKTIANGQEPSVNYGDANYDGIIDIRDLVRVDTLFNNGKYTIGADCMGDEVINSDDIAVLRKTILGLFLEEVNSLSIED